MCGFAVMLSVVTRTTSKNIDKITTYLLQKFLTLLRDSCFAQMGREGARALSLPLSQTLF